MSLDLKSIQRLFLTHILTLNQIRCWKMCEVCTVRAMYVCPQGVDVSMNTHLKCSLWSVYCKGCVCVSSRCWRQYEHTPEMFIVKCVLYGLCMCVLKVLTSVWTHTWKQWRWQWKTETPSSWTPSVSVATISDTSFCQTRYLSTPCLSMIHLAQNRENRWAKVCVLLLVWLCAAIWVIWL